MAFPAFLDTNVLYGAVLVDTLLWVAEAGAYRPHWSVRSSTRPGTVSASFPTSASRGGVSRLRRRGTSS